MSLSACFSVLSRRFGSSPPIPSSSSCFSESNERRFIAILRRTRLHAPPQVPVPAICSFSPSLFAFVLRLSTDTFDHHRRRARTRLQKLAARSALFPPRTFSSRWIVSNLQRPRFSHVSTPHHTHRSILWPTRPAQRPDPGTDAPEIRPV
ncbi:hypothetical protein PIB30_094725 [Stylosanthes scabra]|uniref:Uncharacterized protein n=1 Tax=Stylosanthes scabra TaxID=79078 RepID=A0ABU6RW88_9FABA|nr:hypothetical protein [Stylosanthes scabra]